MIKNILATFPQLSLGFPFFIFLFLILFFLWIFFDNRRIVVRRYSVPTTASLHDSSDITLVCISDLHNTNYGRNDEKLLDKVRDIHPEAILLCGDIMDGLHPNIKKAVSFISSCSDISPVFYITGNHEAARPEEFEEVVKEIRKNKNVHLLENENYIWKNMDGTEINIIGIDERMKQEEYWNDAEKFSGMIAGLTQENIPNILMVHRPEKFGDIKEETLSVIDLVLSGHTHGGQFRLPFIGGLYAPGQGVLPKWCGGEYEEKNGRMIVSRGVGQSSFPFRLNNPPEIIEINLES